MLLDTKTLMVVLTFVVLMTSLALHVTWRLNRAVPGIREWSLGFLNISIGIIMLAAQKVLPAITPVIADLLIINGYYLIWRGVRLFKAEPFLYTRAYWLIATLTGIAITYLTLVADNPGIRILLVTWIIALQLLVLAREFFIDMPYRNAATTLTGITCGLHFLIHTSLGLLIIFGPAVESVFDPLLANQLIFLGGFNTAILLAFGLIIMTTARLQTELKQQASRDPLTGTLNRRAFFSTAEPVLARGLRDAEAMTLLVADLDMFKSVNDQYGHAVGDEVLKLFVKVAKGALRGQDLLARFGGEEFVILLPNTSPEQAVEVAERLRVAFRKACEKTDGMPCTTVSIGIAERGSDDPALDSLIARADQALYQAKQAGRNQVKLAVVSVSA